jgi:exodeoxyribonuclease-3
MKIATINVNGIKTRLPNLLAWLQREHPEVACLQELKAADEAFPAAELRDAGYHALWRGQRSWNGVAILVRGTQPVEIRRELPGDPRDDQGRYLEAAVAGIVVGCLYLPNGNPQPGPKFDYKLAWFERLIGHAATLVDSPHPVLLLGDFNVVPTDFDIYDPRHWRKDALLQPQARACWERLLAQGWVDAIRHLHPQQQVFTFWDYFRQHWQRNAGLRIDHLLLNRRLAPALVEAGVDAWVRGEPHASDHAPTWVRLDLARAAPLRGKAARKAEPAVAKPAPAKVAAAKAAPAKVAAAKVAAAKAAPTKAAPAKAAPAKAAPAKAVPTTAAPAKAAPRKAAGVQAAPRKPGPRKA